MYRQLHPQLSRLGMLDSITYISYLLSLRSTQKDMWYYIIH